MKISKQTISILKNFSSIANSIMVDEPGLLKTISHPVNNIIAIAHIEEELPEFGIYNLDEFVNIVSSLDPDKVEFDFRKDHVIIKDGPVSIRYFFCDPQHVYNKVSNADKVLGFSEFGASFRLTRVELGNIMKFSKVINFGTNNDDEKVLHIEMKDGVGTMTLQNDSNDLMNSFKMDFSGQGDCDCRMKLSSMVFIPGDYDVFVSSKMIKFSAGTIHYFCATKR